MKDWKEDKEPIDNALDSSTDGTYPMVESDDGKFYAQVITDGGDGSLFYPNHGAIVAKWQDTDIDIAFIDMALYALSGWNGEKWCHCWKCKDRFTADSDDDREYEVVPVYKEIAEDEYEVTGYEVY